MSEKRTRGAPRRGPFSGKKITVSTKITEETMERLAAAAGASEMSISQKAEASILRGLAAEEDFQRHFAPALRAFEQSMMCSMPQRTGEVDISDWKGFAMVRVERLAKELSCCIAEICATLGRERVQSSPDSTMVTASTSEVAQRPRRVLDLD